MAQTQEYVVPLDVKTESEGSLNNFKSLRAYYPKETHAVGPLCLSHGPTITWRSQHHLPCRILYLLKEKYLK